LNALSRQPRLLTRFCGFALGAVWALGSVLSAQSAPSLPTGVAASRSHHHPYTEATPTTPGDEQRILNVFRHSPIVQKIGQKMGLDVEVTARIFEGLNFVIIMLAIILPLVRILPRRLRLRSEALAHDIKTARDATAEARQRMSAVEAKLAGLDAQIEEFRAQVEQQSREDEKRIKATLEEETARIVAGAQQEIAMVAAQARRGLRHFAADLAVEQAEKRLTLTAEADKALIEAFISDLSANGNGKGGAR
jgi:F-type H+-transporting ATPase subunit b